MTAELKEQNQKDIGDRFGDYCVAVLTTWPAKIALLIALLLSLSYLSWHPDLDLFARMATGRLFFELGYIPTEDPFAFTLKKELWIDHEWLSGVIFFWIYRTFNDAGIICFQVAMMLLTSLLLLACRIITKTNASFDILLIILFCFSSYGVWGDPVRSLVFTYFGTALWLYVSIQARYYGKNKLLFIMPIYMLLWANAHGGFVVGLGLMGIECLYVGFTKRKEVLPLFCALLLTLLATCLNPYGATRYWEFILHAVSMSRPAVPEWRAIDFLSKEFLWCAIWIIPVAIAFIRQRKVFDLLGAFLIVATLLQGIKSYRLIAFFYLCVFVYGSPYLDWYLSSLSRIITQALKRAAAISSLAFTALALFYFVIVIPIRGDFKLDYSGFPVEATKWLKENKQSGNVLVHFDYGSYALWSLYPQFKISVDGRYEELYPEESVLRSQAAIDPNDPDHLRSLKDLNPDYIVALNRRLEGKESSPYGEGYIKLYNDAAYSLFERSPYGK